MKAPSWLEVRGDLGADVREAVSRAESNAPGDWILEHKSTAGQLVTMRADLFARLVRDGLPRENPRPRLRMKFNGFGGGSIDGTEKPSQASRIVSALGGGRPFPAA